MATKRKLDDIVTGLPSQKVLKARLQPLFPISQALQLQLPSSLDLKSLYTIFSLFISEGIFEFISQSTNEYI